MKTQVQCRAEIYDFINNKVGKIKKENHKELSNLLKEYVKTSNDFLVEENNALKIALKTNHSAKQVNYRQGSPRQDNPRLINNAFFRTENDKRGILNQLIN